MSESLKCTFQIFISATQIINFGSTHLELINDFQISTSITFLTHPTLASERRHANASLYISDADIPNLHLIILDIYICKTVSGHPETTLHHYLRHAKMEMLTSKHNNNSTAPSNALAATTTANNVHHHHLHWKQAPPMRAPLQLLFSNTSDKDNLGI